MKRRQFLFSVPAGIALSGACEAASDFWNSKAPAQWSGEEVAVLLSRSPWAKEVNAQFMNNADYTAGGNAGPAIGPGGRLDAPGTGSSAAPQIEIGGNRSESPGGARRQEPVTVRWESAEPIVAALNTALDPAFKDRYAISVSGLPMGVMDRKRRGGADDLPEDMSPAARQRRMVEQLKGSATLSARGQEPEQAGVVTPAPHTPGTYLFGFSKELLPLDVSSREIVFTLQTALMSVRAKFDTKSMLYHGRLAV